MTSLFSYVYYDGAAVAHEGTQRTRKVLESLDKKRDTALGETVAYLVGLAVVIALGIHFLERPGFTVFMASVVFVIILGLIFIARGVEAAESRLSKQFGLSGDGYSPKAKKMYMLLNALYGGMILGFVVMLVWYVSKFVRVSGSNALGDLLSIFVVFYLAFILLTWYGSHSTRSEKRAHEDLIREHKRREIRRMIEQGRVTLPSTSEQKKKEKRKKEKESEDTNDDPESIVLF